MKRKIKTTNSLIEKLDDIVESRQNLTYFLSLILSLIVFYNLFDLRISLSGDDSQYILRAYNFIKNGTFPTFQGPLYPIILSPFIALFGVSLPLLKILSALFLLGSFFFFFKALKGKVSSSILLFVLFILSINSYIAFYSTQTFSEAFFILVESLLIYLFLTYIIDNSKINFIHYFLFGLLTLMLYLTRSIGLVGIISASLFFIINKEWKKLLAGVSSFSIFFILTEFAKRIFWHIKDSQFSNQLNILLRKHPYQPALGNENLMGFFRRFIDNSNLYLSKHLFRFIGFKNFTSHEISPLLTILIYVLLIVALYFAFRKNKYVLYLVIYSSVFAGTTFIIIQKFWDQDRLIIPVFPFLLFSIIWGIFSLFKIKALKKYQIIPVLLCIVIFFSVLKTTMNKIKENKPVLENSLKGNMIFGYSPDWQNYLLISKYAGDNIPKQDVIACRKPGMSFIFGNHKFYGISSVPLTNIDSVFTNNTTYYAIPGGEEILKLIPREMLKAIFAGKTNNPQYKSQRTYFLFETKSNFDLKGIDKYKVTKSVIQNNFTELKIYSPDNLRNRLLNNNVKYIIIANLRRNPNKKTNLTINTLSRYAEFITIKYPLFLSKIYEVGKDEKAALYKINYN